MNPKEKIEELLEASKDGTITAAQVTEAGLRRSILQEFVKSGEIYDDFPTRLQCTVIEAGKFNYQACCAKKL